ncbi:YqcC family protein [Microbulbifer harenosus]|uniref:YqcC family protein n=1 Tax=Microbulbifer harenosus TaxID=2576840 RepID=A0ABY2UMY1_9GAMM|nr:MULTISPECIES: YqcC family protein [Microbulbifer]QIL89712.1 YqcC family protein [Microbulbifer sp. SH-1]TLM79666.1 YqcC family protein [Microbulbifer harenosus]
MKSIYSDIATLMLELEAELRRLDLWEPEPPSASALASTEPFCVDTLTLPQWLQFVFLPRMSQMVEVETPLPQACGIAPMAEEFFRGSDLKVAGLTRKLEEIDARLAKG